MATGIEVTEAISDAIVALARKAEQTGANYTEALSLAQAVQAVAAASKDLGLVMQ